MSFNPQYHRWSQETFNTSGNAQYSNEHYYRIEEGVAKLFPEDVPFWSDGPWDTISGWSDTNGMNSLSGVQDDFSIFLGTGFEGSTTGEFGNGTLMYGQASYTDVRGAVKDSLGRYLSGEFASAVYTLTGEHLVTNTVPPADNFKFTLQFKYRSDLPQVNEMPPFYMVSGQQNPDGSTSWQVDNSKFLDTRGLTGFLSQGVLIDRGFDYTFIELGPAGTRLIGPGVSGKANPDMSAAGGLKEVRIAVDYPEVTVMHENGHVIYSASGFTNKYGAGGVPTNLHPHISFGAFPYGTGAAYDTGNVNIFDSYAADPYGVTGLAGFAGQTYWDEFKILYDQSITKSPSGYTAQYPTGHYYIWTDPWYPSPDSEGYIGAYFKYNSQTGGTVTLTPEIEYGKDLWSNYSGASTAIIDGFGNGSIALDLSEVPVYSGTSQSKIRFRLDAYSNGGAVAEIDDIVTFANGPLSLVDINPSWKETAVPKDISWFVNYKAYQSMIPPINFQDSVYMHNESGKPAVAVGDQIPKPAVFSATGAVYSSSIVPSSDGFSIGHEGIYGYTWRNFSVQHSVTGLFLGSTLESVDSSSGVFQGTILNGLDTYGSSDDWTGWSGQASVKLSTTAMVGTQDTEYSIAQKAVVKDFYAGNSAVTGNLGYDPTNIDVGFITTGLSTNGDYTSVNRLAIFSGYMFIEKGPGVVATIHEGSKRYPYYLAGANYREAAPFSVAAILDQDHTVSDSSEASLAISFGALPRPSKPVMSRDDQLAWGVKWSKEIGSHSVTDFTVINLSGNITDLSYAEYYDVVEPRVPIALDEVNIDRGSYTGLDRSSMLFEGWFKPAGIITSNTGYVEGTLFEVYTPEDPTTKTKVFINSSGEIRAEVPLSIDLQGYGQPGLGYVDVGYSTDGNRTVATGDIGTDLTSMVLVSNNKSVTWGEWNHIGLALDTRAMGDKIDNSNQPVYPNYSGHILHGSRSSKLYFELNGEIVDSIDVGLNPYTGTAGVTGFQPNELGVNIPDSETYINSWPRIPRCYRSNTASNAETTQGYHIRIGQDIPCEFDHVRFGIRDSVCAKSTLGTLGSKNTPPQFSFNDSPKVPQPIHVLSGGVSHFEAAHIYRFDHLSDYVGWDEGFSPQHMIFKNTKWYMTDDVLTNYGIQPSEMFFKYQKGPKGRPAIRLGPSMVGLVPFGSFDERIYNGEQTLSMWNKVLDSYVGSPTSTVNSNTLYSGDVAAQGFGLNPNINPWSEDLGIEYDRSTSNSILRMGGFAKLNSMPSSGMIGDLFVFSETEYTSDYYDTPDGSTYQFNGHDDGYDLACLYIGVSGLTPLGGVAESGVLVYGTRYSQKDNVSTFTNGAVGPFTGSTVMYKNSWHHIGIEAKTRSGEGYLELVVDGVTDSITTCSFDLDGGTSLTEGVGMGYRGFLGLNASASVTTAIQKYGQRIKSCFRIGGHVPNYYRSQATDTQHIYRHMDTSYSEVVIGYVLSAPYGSYDVSAWDWARLAHLGGETYTGMADAAFANAGTLIGPIYGTGTPLTGTLHYPEVTFGSAGSQVLWGAINMGDDIEGPAFKGLAVFDDELFTNSASYYATFDDDNTESVLGSDDSPIQIGTRVPSHGINLGVLNAKEWTTENTLTNFDLSDHNYANITNKLFGDYDVREFIDVDSVGDSYAMTIVPQVDTTDIRLSSLNIWTSRGIQDLTAFYMHIIGGDEKEVYIQGADTHMLSMQTGLAGAIDTGRYEAFYNNRDKVYASIQCRDADGVKIPYEKFPYSLITVPFSPSSTGVIGDVWFGYHSGVPTGQFLADGHYTTILVSSKQTIGKSIFIHYASSNNKTDVISLNDSEVYNPIPIVRQDDFQDIYYLQEPQGRPDCSFSLVPDGTTVNMYNAVIWGADMSGWAVQPS